MITSVCNSDTEALSRIMSLYLPNGIDADITYSTGNFYKCIERPNLRSDINNQPSTNVVCSADRLPYRSLSLKSIVFDPPFLATTGPSLQINNSSNKINKRFTVFNSEKLLHTFYKRTLLEVYRVLKPEGYLLFKCQDKVSSGKQYLSHVFIINEAIRLNYYVKDLFILITNNRITADWQRNQQHSRKYHSYWLVIQKTDKIINYV